MVNWLKRNWKLLFGAWMTWNVIQFLGVFLYVKTTGGHDAANYIADQILRVYQP